MPEEWTVRSIVAATFPLLVVLTLVELGSGLALDTAQDVLTTYPALLTLVPAIIGMAGNLGSVLASRLSTAFHLGTLDFAPGNDALAGNAAATVALSVTLFPLVGVGAWAVQFLLGSIVLPLPTVVLVAAASGVVLAAVTVVVATTATYAAYRFRLDPDDVVIPAVTTICDVLGVLVLLLAIRVFV